MNWLTIKINNMEEQRVVARVFFFVWLRLKNVPFFLARALSRRLPISVIHWLVRRF